ncbi:hypothetical protein JVT61DRAFT_5910 [Boletus reticuloceps]|uniref:Uncharacterized protein n=1 Tax=Boletus reticuloceps TaxID=495285 RepID=A0A8I2YMA6_9AGAM|nr:hypothetical protein JVT61DRAFT_5910 [Boletus reticuloceps]
MAQSGFRFRRTRSIAHEQTRNLNIGSLYCHFLRAYLLTTSRESDDGSKEYGLYFHGSHSIIDARSALHAINLVCEWLSGEGMDITDHGDGGPHQEWDNWNRVPAGVRRGECSNRVPPTRELNISVLLYHSYLGFGNSCDHRGDEEARGFATPLFHAASDESISRN